MRELPHLRRQGIHQRFRWFDDVHVSRWVLRHTVRQQGKHVHGMSGRLVEDGLDDLRRQRTGDHQRVRRDFVHR